MSTQAERRYSSRTRSKPITQYDTANIDQPIKATARARPNGELKKLLPQPRRIPALTTSRTFGPKSPIVNADIQLFLAKCMNTKQWERYTDAEQQSIIASLPLTRQSRFQKDSPSSQSEQVQNDGLPRTPPLSAEFCSNDLYLKRAVARFKRDLADGYYEKSWQEKAGKAHRERFQGEFDDYVRQHAEEMFPEEDADGVSTVDDLPEESEDSEYAEVTHKNGKTRKTQKGG